MIIAGVGFAEEDCDALEELAREDLALTLEVASKRGQKNLTALWAAVDDSFRLLDRVISRSPSIAHLSILASLAFAESLKDGDYWYRLGCALVEAVELQNLEDLDRERYEYDEEEYE